MWWFSAEKLCDSSPGALRFSQQLDADVNGTRDSRIIELTLYN